jgi:hypothetical protein
MAIIIVIDENNGKVREVNNGGSVSGGTDVPGKNLNTNPITDGGRGGIDDAEQITVLNKRGNSPCCIIVGGKRYCWC